MAVSVHPAVQQSLLEELNLVMRHYFHQSVDEVLIDLHCRIRQIQCVSDPDTMLRGIYNSGVLYQRSDKIVSQMRNALSRFVHGTFGRCSSCGEEIPHPSLETTPTCDLCPQCIEARHSFVMHREEVH
jgi:RNA polymerase-binding transcription factor DksA